MERVIFIDVKTEYDPNKDCYSFGQRYFIDPYVEYQFTVTFFDNGVRTVMWTFRSSIRWVHDLTHGLDNDFDEKGFAEKILRDINTPVTQNIWSPDFRVKSFDDSVDHVVRIEFSPKAKEIFDVLLKYKPKLLEQFTNQVNNGK